MKSIKRVLVLLLCVAMVLSFAACSNEQAAVDTEEKTTQGTESKTEEETKVESEEEIELYFTHYLTGDGAAEVALKTAVEKYVSDNPNVVLNEEPMSVENYEQKIKTLAAANEMPDVYLIKGSMVDNFVENELIEPLNGELEARSDWYENFVVGAFDDFTRDGNVYAVPFKAEKGSLGYYNKEIFAEVGYDEFPKTWVEFEDLIVKLQDAGYTPISLGNKGKWVVECCILSALGDRYTGTEWFHQVKVGEASFENPDFIAALTALQGLAEMGAFNEDMNSIANKEMRAAYYNREAAMFFEGDWAISMIASQAPEDIAAVTGLAILPSVEGGKGNPMSTSGASAWGYQINPNLTGAKREAAIDLVEAVTGQYACQLQTENNGFPGGKPGDFDESKLSPLRLDAEDLLATLEGGSPTYDAQLSSAVIETMNAGLQELLMGTITPEELAAKIQAENE